MSLSRVEALPGGIAIMPPMIYGTAWKKNNTSRLTYEALSAGFRGFDTAAMTKHYNEKATGHALQIGIAQGICKREQVYIQTKFTPNDEQFSNKALYPNITEQVTACVMRSLATLATNHKDPEMPAYLDCVLLHSPYDDIEDTLEAWNALSKFVPQQVRSLGFSNITSTQLLELMNYPSLIPAPSVVQNRFYAGNADWDADIRALCARHSIVYQGFWTLTANKVEWINQDYVKIVAEGAAVGRQVAWYAFLIADKIVILNGTSDEIHMHEDLDGLESVRNWAKSAEGQAKWTACLAKFRYRTRCPWVEQRRSPGVAAQGVGQEGAGVTGPEHGHEPVATEDEFISQPVTGSS